MLDRVAPAAPSARTRAQRKLLLVLLHFASELLVAILHLPLHDDLRE